MSELYAGAMPMLLKEDLMKNFALYQRDLVRYVRERWVAIHGSELIGDVKQNSNR